MRKLKKAIAILVVILLIILIVLIIKLKGLLSANELQNIEEFEADISADFIKELGLVEDYSTFFSVEDMLKKFIMRVEYGSKKLVYNFIDSSYINEKNITQDNVLDKLSDITQYASKIRIKNIYEKTNVNNAIYYIDCILEKEQKGKEFYFSIIKDLRNLTYSVIPLEKNTYKNEITKLNQEIEEKTIEKNSSNKVSFINPTEEEIVTKYFEDFIGNALNYTEYTYELLDSKYKEVCFHELQDFKDYIQSKTELYRTNDIANLKQPKDFKTQKEYEEYINQIKRLKLSKYQIRKEKGYNRYICIDTEGSYYTFYATSPFNYTVVLGNYVIPIEDFTETYNSSTEVEKVVLNIKRFFMGIDDKNYGYSYNVLSQAFKENNYQTKDKFVQYVKQNFFEENKIQYISCEKQNGLYIYKIKITDATGKSAEEKSLNMIMKLNNGTDFEMSFGTN